MAIEAELEDGTLLEFPDGTPQDVVDRAVRSHLGAEAPKQSYAEGALQEFTQGATLGFADEVQSVIAAAIASPFVSDKTFGQLMVDARNSLRQDREQFTQDNPKTSLALNVAGGLATGGALAKAGGAALSKAGVQAAETTAGQFARAGAGFGAAGGAGFADAPEFLSFDTALSAALGAGAGAASGALLGKATEKAGAVIRGITQRPQIQVFDERGQFTDDAINALDELVASGRASQDDVNTLIQQSLADDVLTPEQAKRFNLFQRRGVTPTRANITQATDDFRDQQSAIKRTGRVSETVAAQDRQLESVVANAADDIAPAQSLSETNASISTAINNFANRSDEIVSAAYKEAEKAATGQPLVSFDNLMSAVQANRGSERVSGGVISYLRGALKNKGLLRAGTEMDINKRGTGTSGITRKTTVKEAEEIRKELNSLWDSATPKGKRIIGQLKNAIDDDVAAAVGDDIFAEARKAKIQREAVISRGRRNKFDTGKDSLFEKLINNEIPEEKITQTLTSKSTRLDEFKNLKDFLVGDLDDETIARAFRAGRPPQGVKAWYDLKAQVMRDALDSALSTAGKTEGGGAVFNVRKFRAAFDGLKESGKFNELFSADERQLIQDVIEIGNLRIPQNIVQSGGGPSEVAIKMAKTEILKRIPIVGNGAAELVDLIANVKTDNRLLDVTRETTRALGGRP